MNGFEEFWKTYPRKVGKRAAQQAFAKACKRSDVAEIMAGAVRYRDDPERKRKGGNFTAHPNTWLNQDRWLDEEAFPEERHATDLLARFEGEPEGITFDEWLAHHATPEEIEKARQFGVGLMLATVSA